MHGPWEVVGNPTEGYRVRNKHTGRHSTATPTHSLADAAKERDRLNAPGAHVIEARSRTDPPTFTPGPWEIERPNPIRQPDVLLSIRAAAHRGEVCCGVFHESDARLIAEAPALLALAQHAARMDLAPDVLQKRALAILARLGVGESREILARARGEA